MKSLMTRLLTGAAVVFVTAAPVTVENADSPKCNSPKCNPM